jgi:hypothetical protein
MRALFDQNSELVAWTDESYIFDTGMNWIGYVAGGYVWRASDNVWIGVFDSLTLQDRNGRAFLWSADEQPISGLPPLTPLQPLRPLLPRRPLMPLRPLRPLQPLIPLGGWSDLSFYDAF